MRENRAPDLSPAIFVSTHDDYRQPFQITHVASELVDATTVPDLEAKQDQSACRYTFAFQNAAAMLSQKDAPVLKIKVTHLVRDKAGVILESGWRMAPRATRIAQTQNQGTTGGTIVLYTRAKNDQKSQRRCDSFRSEAGLSKQGVLDTTTVQVTEYHPRHSSFTQ